MAEILRRAAEHKGTSFVEVYQNCVIFNDKTWGYATDRETKDDNVILLEDGKPMIFGKNKDKGITLKGCLEPQVVSLEDFPEEDLLLHSETAPSSLAYMLSRMREPNYPEPIGVFRAIEDPVYETGVLDQVNEAVRTKGRGDLNSLFRSAETWEVFPDTERGNGHKASKAGEDSSSPSEFDEEYTGVMFNQEGDVSEAGPSLVTDTLDDLQPKKPLIASVDISLAEAINQLKRLNVGMMVLVDKKGKLAGVFTEGDIFTKVVCKVENLEEEKVKDYMSTNITTLKCEDTIAYALHLMSIHKFRHIPIVDDKGKPDSVISFRSVVHYLGKHFSSGNGS
jgi:predicted transcriptional regulator